MNKIDIYPLTIVCDRYTGVYSGGRYTAWNLQPYAVPEEIYSDDCSCADFWLDNDLVVGLGDSPESAAFDLFCKLIEWSDTYESAARQRGEA